MRTDKNNQKHKSYWEVFLAVFLACLMTLGFIISISSKNESIFGPISRNFTGVAFIFAFTLSGFLLIIRFLWLLLDKEESDKFPIIEKNLPLSRDWMKIAGVIFLCWLPYLIICYPTITRGYDYFWQLLQGTGVFPLSGHHPVLGSIVYGLLFKIGYSLGGASFGLFFTSLLQSIVLAASAGFSLSSICYITCVPDKVRRIMALIICLCPVFPGHAVWLIKDAFFTAFGILFFTQIYIRIQSHKSESATPIIASRPAIVISGLVISLYRNGITPIAIIAIAVLFFYELKNSDKPGKHVPGIIAAVTLFFAVTIIWGKALSFMDTYPTDKREALSLPTRQIIRTVQLHPEALTNDVMSVLDIAYNERLSYGYTMDDIISKYDDMNADYIKIDYVNDEEFLPSYIKLWITLGIEHPGAYIDAFLRGTDGYWYAMKNPHLEAQGVIIHTVCTTGPEDDFANEDMRERRLDSIFTATVKSLEYAEIDTGQTFSDLFEQYPWLKELMSVKSAFPGAREKLGVVLAVLEEIPLVSMIMAPGTYLWLMLFCLAYMFSRKREGRFLWPIIMIELMAMLSPVNGYTRYVLIVEYYSIIMIGMCFSSKNQIKNGIDNTDALP